MSKMLAIIIEYVIPACAYFCPCIFYSLVRGAVFLLLFFVELANLKKAAREEAVYIRS